MANISAIKLPNGTTYDIKDAKLSGVYPVKGTQTAKTGSWTGVIDAPALYDGMTIAYYLPYAGDGNATLNLTLSDGTTTGAINCYETANNRLTTHYGAGSTILLTYWSAGSISIAGTATTDNRWTRADYDSTITYRLTDYYGYYKAYTTLYRYQICLTKNETSVLPINTVNNSTATTKTLTTESFNPFGPIYYYVSTTTIAADGTIGANTLSYQYLADLRYSFNTGSTLTAAKAVYLVATLGAGCTATLAANPISQTLPTTADGYIYIYLGQTYDNYRIELSTKHPVYRYINGALRTLTPDTATINGMIPATSVSVTGSGNAVTTASLSNGALTLTKGTTFLTSHQDISGKIDTAGTGLSKSGTTLNHSNSVTAQATQAVYPIKIDAQGHISAYGSAVTIPGITKVTATLGTTWTSNQQTVTVSGVTTSNTVIVSPAPASYEAYCEAGIYCSAQAANSLTFKCDTAPSASLTVNVMIVN